MTMALAYTWHDKIILMADKRSTEKDNEGKILSYQDTSMKVFPVVNKMVIAHAGLSIVPIGGGQYFELTQIIENFIKVHQQTLQNCSGKVALEGLVEMWDRTLSEKLGRDPKDQRSITNFLLCTWETGLWGVEPKVYGYHSIHGINFARSAAIGDDEVKPIIKPYIVTNTDEMTFEESIKFFKKGFAEVIEKVETVGGSINAYVLDVNPIKSHWLWH